MKTKLLGRAFQARANLPGGPGPQQSLRGGASLRKAHRRGRAHGSSALGAARLSPDCPLPGGHLPAGGQAESPFRPIQCPLFASQLGVQACSGHTLTPQPEIRRVIMRRKEETRGVPDPPGMLGRGAASQRGSEPLPRLFAPAAGAVAASGRSRLLVPWMRCQKVKVRCVKFGASPPKAISSRHSAESEAHEGRVARPRPLLTLQAVEGQGSLWVGLSVCEYWPPRGGCRVPLGGARSPQTGEVPGLPLVAKPSSFTLGAGPGRRHWVPFRQTAPTSLPASLGVGESLQPGTGDAFPVTPHWKDSPTHC